MVNVGSGDGIMQDYEKLYNDLKNEYEAYQKFSEKNRQELCAKNVKLEHSNNSLFNIVEISKYINTFFSDDNLISMINDMIIGILGVAYSTIFLMENDELMVKATNIQDSEINLTSKEIECIHTGQELLINSKETIKTIGDECVEIHSVMGVPILLRDKFMGYIIVEHKVYKFMTVELKVFLGSIANQIAISIENSYLYKQLERMTQMDPLMDIYNRKFFFQLMDKFIKENNEEKFAIVMIDIDNFKKVNDNYGHQFGDKILINTAKVIKNWLGENDIIARYGGEEIILYITNFDDEISVYNKVSIIRRSIENSIVNFQGREKSVTASFGISYFPLDGQSINELIRIADNLLYKAKKVGKNKVITSYNGELENSEISSL